MVVHLRMLCSKDVKIRDFNDILEEKGERTFQVVRKRGVAAWKSKPYQGRIEFRRELSPVIDVSIWGKRQDRVTGSFIEWIIRNASDKVLEINVYLP